MAFGQGYFEDVERHADDAVVTHHADEVDDTGLAEGGFCAAVGGLGDAVRGEVFRDEIVDDALGIASEGRRGAGAHGFDNFWREPGLFGQAGVCPEFVLRLPVLAGEDDGKLREVLWEAAPETAVFTELLGAVRELGAAQPGFERPTQAAAGACGDRVCDFGLLGGEGVEIERGKAGQGDLQRMLGRE